MKKENVLTTLESEKRTCLILDTDDYKAWNELKKYIKKTGRETYEREFQYRDATSKETKNELSVLMEIVSGELEEKPVFFIVNPEYAPLGSESEWRKMHERFLLIYRTKVTVALATWGSNKKYVNDRIRLILGDKPWARESELKKEREITDTRERMDIGTTIEEIVDYHRTRESNNLVQIKGGTTSSRKILIDELINSHLEELTERFYPDSGPTPVATIQFKQVGEDLEQFKELCARSVKKIISIYNANYLGTEKGRDYLKFIQTELLMNLQGEPGDFIPVFIVGTSDKIELGPAWDVFYLDRDPEIMRPVADNVAERVASSLGWEDIPGS